MVKVNGIQFQTRELDGEVFYQAVLGCVRPQSLKEVIRDIGYKKRDVRVFDPKNGVFSVVSDRALFMWNEDRDYDEIRRRVDALYNELFPNPNHA